MPTKIYFESWDEKFDVATPEEVLDFANSVREAGGGDIIPELFPSIKRDVNHCLIAKALNFDCEVVGVIDKTLHRDGFSKMIDYMMPYYMMGADPHVAFDVATNIGLPICAHSWQANVLYILLPQHIGNAVYAFDEGLAFEGFDLDNLPQ